MESSSERARREWRKKRIRELNKRMKKAGLGEVSPLSNEEPDVDEEEAEEEGLPEERYLIVWRARMWALAGELAEKRGKPRYIA